MDPNVKAWLLGKARKDLKKSCERLREAKDMEKEYEYRVVDPSWSPYEFEGEPPRDLQRPGAHIWGEKVREWRRERLKREKQVRMLEKVVEDLK